LVITFEPRTLEGQSRLLKTRIVASFVLNKETKSFLLQLGPRAGSSG